jgi:hypothetical protein
VNRPNVIENAGKSLRVNRSAGKRLGGNRPGASRLSAHRLTGTE